MDDLPESRLEQVTMLEGVLTASATGGVRDSVAFDQLRRLLLEDDELKPLLPGFVRTCRSLDAFWPFISKQSGTYAGRREYLSTAFNPIIEHLEGRNRAPSDAANSEALATFDADGVHAVWAKALARRQSDPEGAITVARTLLETICKRILHDEGVAYGDKDDLPKLYGLAARSLRLAPDHHKEEPIKAILGGAMNLVNGIGTLRNRFSDAHAQSVRAPVKPSERHAKMAVNMAGAMATFLVETYLEQKQS